MLASVAPRAVPTRCSAAALADGPATSTATVTRPTVRARRAVLAPADLETLRAGRVDGPPVVNMDVRAPVVGGPGARRSPPAAWPRCSASSRSASSSFLGGGGSNSPEGAVRQLADAIDHEDPLAAVDVLAPSEVLALARQRRRHQPPAAKNCSSSKTRASRSRASTSASAICDSRLRSSRPDSPRSTISGLAISARRHRDGVAELIRRAWNDERPDSMRRASTRATCPPEVGTFVVAVQQDGRWYVSPAYTALEYVRVVNELPAADSGPDAPRSRRSAPTRPRPRCKTRSLRSRRATGAASGSSRRPNELPLYDYRAALDQALADTDGPELHDRRVLGDVRRSPATARKSGYAHTASSANETPPGPRRPVLHVRRRGRRIDLRDDVRRRRARTRVHPRASAVRHGRRRANDASPLQVTAVRRAAVGS